MKQPIKAKKKPVKKSPLYVNDENDYRYKAYSDSSALHDSYKYHRKYQNAAYDDSVKEYVTDMQESISRFKKYNPGEPVPDWMNNSKDMKSLKATRAKNIAPVGSTRKTIGDGYTDKGNYDKATSPSDVKVINHNKALIGANKDKRFKIGNYASPDLYHRTIKDKREEWDGQGYNPVYDKPKQPVFIKGSEKAKIAREQEKYGVEADGVWGPASQKAKDEYLANEASAKKKAETERLAKVQADKKVAEEKIRLEKEAEKAKQSEVLANGMRRVSSGSNANNLSGDGGSSGWFKDSKGNYVPAPRALKKK